MNKLNKYLLSLIALSSVSVIFIQGNTEKKTLTPTEERSEQTSEFDLDKIKIETKSESDRKIIQDALRELYSTERGKELLKKMPKDISFFSEDYLEKKVNYDKKIVAGYDYERKIIILAKNALDAYKKGQKTKYSLAGTLGHEIIHAIQDDEKRLNKCLDGDGIEGYSDYIILKLREIETNLFDAEWASFRLWECKNGSTELGFGIYFKYLKDIEEADPNNEGKSPKDILKSVRTKYVKTSWESDSKIIMWDKLFVFWNDIYKEKQLPPERIKVLETYVDSSFQTWNNAYAQEITDKTKFDKIGPIDREKSNQIIQSYISSMDVNLSIAYFQNEGHPENRVILMNEQSENQAYYYPMYVYYQCREMLSKKVYNKYKTSEARLAVRKCLTSPSALSQELLKEIESTDAKSDADGCHFQTVPLTNAEEQWENSFFESQMSTQNMKEQYINALKHNGQEHPNSTSYLQTISLEYMRFKAKTR